MSPLEKYEPEVPDEWSLYTEMAIDTLYQIKKDFALHGEELTIPSSKLDSYQCLLDVLATSLEEKAFLQSPKFGRILYQIDLKESDLYMELREVQPQNVYWLLADKIIKRCFEKVFWRYKMREQK